MKTKNKNRLVKHNWDTINVKSISHKSNRMGFSLIEVLVVLAILGLFVGIGLPVLQSQRQRNLVKNALSDLQAEAEKAQTWSEAVRLGTSLAGNEYNNQLVAYGIHFSTEGYTIWEVWNSSADPDDWESFSTVDASRKTFIAWDGQIELKVVTPAGVTDILFVVPTGSISADFGSETDIRITLGIQGSGKYNRQLCFNDVGKIYDCST
jgi:prepilin-type N-terminal cleavage/methylation domain-containing protein